MGAELRYALIVFDWDGTLIDSPAAIVECIQAASRDLGLQAPDPERASYVIGLGLEDSLRQAVPQLARERYGEFADSYRRHFLAREDFMPLFPGVPQLLERLRERGHRLAVATGKSRRGLERALAASGLGIHFASSRCADETFPKPDPAMLRELMAELEVEPERALMVGDTSHDLLMARSAGVDALAVSYGAHAASKLRALEPLACLASVEELDEWLTRHG
ncbi:MAG TPA: HAD-IA family hydrolase [Burkholderiales bacterium]|nr:HAD-IA family hydrolase [Burkholderiales bacterium]